MYHLDSAGTSNKGINTITTLGATTTSRAVDQRKKKMSDVYRGSGEVSFTTFGKNLSVKY